MHYEDFDCLIDRADNGYKIRVLNSPAGQALCETQLPFSELEIENFILKVSLSRRMRRGIESPELETVRDFGERLFRAFFKDEIGVCLLRSLDDVKRQNAGLRLRLRLADAPELLDLPWEYLYNPTFKRFFCLSDYSSLNRYMDLPQLISPLFVKPPLRVLVMVSAPFDAPELNVEQEWANLKTALHELENRGLFVIDRLQAATLQALRTQLRKAEYHVFHFIGHGSFDKSARKGSILLEDEHRRRHEITSEHLADVLHNEPTLRLVILNACEGGRTSRSDPFAGAAQKIVQQGIPAVIAMQFAVTDSAAIAFSEVFYGKIAKGLSLDESLAETRQALYDRHHQMEWATPVLYMRAKDGRLFDIAASKQAQGTNAQSEKDSKPHSENFDALYSMQVRLSVLYYLDSQSHNAKGLSIKEIVTALGIQRRKFLVPVLDELAQAALIDKTKMEKRAFWKITDTGRETVSKLHESIATRVQWASK